VMVAYLGQVVQIWLIECEYQLVLFSHTALLVEVEP
jgi:hypothetical protein